MRGKDDEGQTIEKDGRSGVNSEGKSEGKGDTGRGKEDVQEVREWGGGKEAKGESDGRSKGEIGGYRTDSEEGGKEFRG